MEFPSVFKEGIGLANETISIKVKEGHTPVFRKHRKVPYALMARVEKEIDDLVKAGCYRNSTISITQT